MRLSAYLESRKSQEDISLERPLFKSISTTAKESLALSGSNEELEELKNELAKLREQVSGKVQVPAESPVDILVDPLSGQII